MRQVALFIESSRSYGRGLLKGIAAYVGAHGHWSIRHQEMSINAPPPKWLGQWKGDGILARIESNKLAETIRALGIPAVDLRCSKRIEGVPQINADDQAVIQMAVDHLRERGLKRFAFCGFATADYSIRRLELFQDYVNECGFETQVYESRGPRNPTTMGAEQTGMLDQDGVTAWLESLEKPIGLLAVNDIRGQQVLQCCEDAGIGVPDDVAVIGIDNDDVICPLCRPNLTSVELDTPRIGHEAAALLDRMMDGDEPPEDTVLVPPSRVIIRGSSDVVAIDDRVVATAYRFLREHACRGISVTEVVDQVPLSRRSLERRIREHFGRSPAELIAQTRLARVKQLLEATELPLKQIARLTGFVHDEHMAVFFRKHVGRPPGQYRTDWQAAHLKILSD